MTKKFIYNINDNVDDYVCVDIKFPKKGSKKSVKYIMKCQICGREKSMLGSCIYYHKGTTHKSCGKGLKTKNKRFYSIWCAMRTRTTNPHYEHWNDYGGRGISSEDFKYFIDFYDSMFTSYKKACKKYGEKNVSLERKNVNKNYTKKNCTWIHINDQKGNQRKTIHFILNYPDGTTIKSKNIHKYAKEHGLNCSTLQDLVNGRIHSYYGITGYRI